MYIIDKKNKDYYDGVVGTMGIDKTIVYERNRIEIQDGNEMLEEFLPDKTNSWYYKQNNHFLNITHMRNNSKKYDNAHFFLVGFCGKLYLGWKFEYYVNGREDGIEIKIPKTDIIYGFDNAKKYLKSGFWKNTTQEDIDYVLNYDPINMFRKVNSPIFIYDSHIINTYLKKYENTLIINPILKDYKFYKVVDAFTAFQEIQMFLGGVLGRGEKEIIQVEDKYKIPQHGFDKWSFRKKPTKNK